MFHLTDGLLVLLLVFAIFYDLTQKRIPNFLTFPAILLGFFIYALTGGWSGLLQGLAGFGLGIAVFFIPFALGGMGAGDVKLMGAIGALKGVEFILYTTVFTALSGGIIALIYLFLNGQLLILLKKYFFKGAGFFLKALYFRLRNPYFNQISVYYSSRVEGMQLESKKTNLPYGVAIAVGALIVLGNGVFEILPVIKW